MLPSKIGQILLLGNALDGHIQLCVRDMHCHEAVVNTAVMMGCTEGIVLLHDNNLLASNSDYITFGKDWAKPLLQLHIMDYSKRRASTSAKVPQKDFFCP